MARQWTVAEDDLVREFYGKITNKDLAERIGGGTIALQVFRRAIKLGLEEEPAKGKKSAAKKSGSSGAGSAGKRKIKPEKRSRVLVEAELAAMQAVLDALEGLEAPQQRRVMQYANARLRLFKISPETQTNDGN